jgi:acetylornithine deacetylase
MQTAKDILRALVAIPSVTSMPNAPLLDAIEAILASRNWFTQRLPYTAADGLEKANMLAVPERFRGNLPNVELLFVCHTDTVPYRTDWPAATTLEERDGALHGCGSCDVKGAMAGLLAAALEVDPEALPEPVGFAFTAEEEIGCIGATKLVASGVIHPRRLVVCEPTSLRPATAGKGYGLAEVEVRGHEAHSAFPFRGLSAINVAAQLIVALDEFQQAGKLERDALFTPPYTTFNVGTIQGGSAKNIVAGCCTFLVEWRPLPSEDPRYGGEIVRRLAAEVAQKNPGCVIDARILRMDAGFARPAVSHLGASLSALLHREQTGISFGSEATRFSSIVEEVVVIGPGDMETAHSERECIPQIELDEWTRTVKHLLLGKAACAA